MIEIIAKPRGYTGHVLGLQQPSLHVFLKIEVPSRSRFEAIERCMRDCLGEDFPEPDDRPASGEDLALRLGRRMAEWTASIQRKVHAPISQTFFSRSQPSAQGSRAVLLALPCTQGAMALRTLEWVIGRVHRAARDKTAPGTEALEDLLGEIRSGGEQGTNTFHIAEAAFHLGMPVSRARAGLAMQGSLMIGHGFRARWFRSTITDRTSAFGVHIARDKSSTATLLRQAGLPGSVHEFAASAADAVAIATRLGYPVVVKPADLDQGVGVAADLRDPEQVTRAFEQARVHSGNVLVERHCDGFTHRLTVVEGRVVKIVRRIAGGVHGDGIHDVEELIGIAAADPRRQRRRQRTGVSALTLDEEALALLAQAGLRADSVPASGTYVRLRRRDNVNAGGSNVAIPIDTAHPDNIDLAIRTAALLRLDIAGVDLIIGDIGRSWLDCEALICEVNAQPQMGTSGTPGVYRDMLRSLLPDGARIPVSLAMTVVPGQPSAAILANVRRRCEPQTLAHAGGLFVAGRPVSRPFAGGFEAAIAALTLPETRSLSFVMSAEEVLLKGLPVDRVDRIGMLIDPGADEDAIARARRALALVGSCADAIETW